MILNIAINYNNYKEKVIENFIWFNIPCPTCKNVGYFTRHAAYKRNLCILEDETFKGIKINIQRVYCKHCKHTHAILPIEAIPYCYYSLNCVLQVLTKYYSEEDTVEEIVDKYSITQKLIYIFVAKYIAHIRYIIDFLRIFFHMDLTNETSLKIILETFLAKFKNYSILKLFFNCSNKILFMTRSLIVKKSDKECFRIFIGGP